MDLYRITDNPDLVKDMDSKAVLNTNYAAYLEHVNKQKMAKEVTELKNDIQEIKELLNKVLSSHK